MHRLALLVTIALVTGAGCQGSSSGTPSPPPGPENTNSNSKTNAEADANSPADPAAQTPAPPSGSCDELERQYDDAAAALRRACTDDSDCDLHWSEFNCYARRGKDDDTSRLDAIDEVMKAQGCHEVECEPPPPLKCASGRCEWKT